MSELPFDTEMRAAETRGAYDFAMMILGSLQANKMPPTEVFKWLVHYMTLSFIQFEYVGIGGDQHVLKQRDFCLSSILFLREIIRQNKMLVLEEEMNKLLRARLLRLPPDYDHTYEGALR